MIETCYYTPLVYDDLSLNGIKRKHMVLGFMFHDFLHSVVLLRKTHPDWQAGLLNGVGGKIEPGESPIAAMVREYREEVHCQTRQEDWFNFGCLNGASFNVQLFAAANYDCWKNSYTDNVDQEKLELCPVPLPAHQYDEMIDNLPVIVAAAAFALKLGRDRAPQFYLNYSFTQP